MKLSRLLKVALWSLIPAVALAAAISPYGIFGGVTTTANLPASAPQNTVGFTSDNGIVTSNGTSWFVGAVDTTPTFTIASGCATVSALTGAGTAGKFATSLTGTCTPVITLPTAANGWTCYAADITAAHQVVFTQTASTTTSCTVSGATTASDVVVFMAKGF